MCCAKLVPAATAQRVCSQVKGTRKLCRAPRSGARSMCEPRAVRLLCACQSIARVQVLTYQLWGLRWLDPTEMPKKVTSSKALGSGDSRCMPAMQTEQQWHMEVDVGGCMPWVQWGWGCGCLLLLLQQGSSPLAEPAMGELLLQGDCKMDLAEAEAQRAKCAKLNQLCFVDCFSFLTSHQTNTTLGPEQKLRIPLLFLPFPC